MNVATVTMPPDAARRKFLEYRQAVAAGGSADDQALMQSYREISRGRRVLHLHQVMRQAGVDDAGRPRLAIARADATHCWFRSTHWGSGWGDRALRWVFAMEESMRVLNRRRYKSLPHAVLADADTSKTLRAVVPTIPPALRPKAKLHNYWILWEAEWETVPTDPLLLRHLGREFYAVLAQWDLTELERLVLFDRL